MLTKHGVCCQAGAEQFVNESKQPTYYRNHCQDLSNQPKVVMSSRPSSSRPQMRFNPITGEEMPYSSSTQHPAARETPRQTSRETPKPTYRETPRQTSSEAYDQTRQHRAPVQFREQRQNSMDGKNFVPPLNLSRLVGRDEDDEALNVDPNKYLPLSPSSASNVSWGPATPKPAYQPSTQHLLMKEPNYGGTQQKHPQMAPAVKKPTAWDRSPVPEGLPAPSQRQRDQYRQLAEEQRAAYQQRVAPIAVSDVDRKIEQLRLAIPPCEDKSPEEDSERDTMQRGWTQAPYSKEAMLKIRDREEFEEEKRKSKMLETVLVDQLCRPVISDPQQNIAQTSRPSPSYHPGMKRVSLRTLHDSKIRTDGTPTENLLSRRVRFDARVVTTLGRDAIRELSGFFFAADNTLTIYEYRRLGKSSKATPFIKRGAYSRPRDLRCRDPYTLADIKQGGDLCFECDGQPLPDSLKDLVFITIRVTDVDNDAKQAILLSGLVGSEREEMWKASHLPRTKEELAARLLMEDVQRIVRRQIPKRGLRVYTGLGRLFRKASKYNEDEKVNKYELEKGLIDLCIEIPQEKVDDLWDVLDVDSTSFLPYSEFMRAYLGEMNESRKLYVLKAFAKIDSAKQGVVTLGEMSKFYNAHKHPRVKSGECVEEQILEMFLSSFEDTTIKSEVTFREFEEYYEGLSIGIESDLDFINILKNAWNV